MSIKSLVKQVLIEKQNRRYDKLLSDRSVTYAEWLKEREAQENVAAANEADSLYAADVADAGAEVVVLCAADGCFAENAVINIKRYFAECPQVQMLYGDEDIWEKTDSEKRDAEPCAPWFKPDWSPDLLDSCFYFGSVVALKKALYEKCCEQWDELRGAGASATLFGEFAEADVASVKVCRVQNHQAYIQWVRVCVAIAGGYQKQCASIGHISEILYHVQDEKERADFWQAERSEERGRTEKLPLLSVIIPSKDNPEILRKCIYACLEMDYPALEIVVVDNGSNRKNRTRIDELLDELWWTDHSEEKHYIHYYFQPMEFNFSKMCNIGAGEAKGEVLLFLNDDVELCQADTLRKMVKMAMREYTGAVGLKLYYPDSCRIQHAGITNLPMGPVHKLQFKEDNNCYYFGMNRGCRNVIAVTAACLMVEKKKFLEAGGFSEELRVAFNDVDLCFGLFEAGYHNVCVNDCFAYHHESLSRGDDESKGKLARLTEERKKLYARHPQIEGRDPYYSVHLNRYGLDTSVRPCHEVGRNRVQQVSCVEASFNEGNYRQDNCLLVRIEDARQGKISGYGVVLGDNNACYEKKLLLKKQEPDKAAVCAVFLAEQLRPDLAENMCDQKNVALSGFDVQLEAGAVPEGKYLVGMAAKNRVTGLKLINWSNRVVELK